MPTPPCWSALSQASVSRGLRLGAQLKSSRQNTAFEVRIRKRSEKLQMKQPKMQRMRYYKKCLKGNLQKLVFLLRVDPRDYSKNLRHVEKAAHANFELRRCLERPVMTTSIIVIFLIVFHVFNVRSVVFNVFELFFIVSKCF